MIKQIKRIRNKMLAWLRERRKRKNYHQLIGKKIIHNEQANDLIYKSILDGNPCFITRFGSSELATLLFYLQARMANPELNKWNSHHQHILCDVSGFFPFTEAAMDQFSKYYLSFIQHIDMLGVWNVGEENMIKYFNPKIQLINLQGIEPYYFKQPWSRALAGKKVLVIHPFAESIRQQYARRQKLYPGREVLPAFELKVIQAVQSVANNTQGFKAWFEALEYMCNEISKADFDVAIIGAGAYGMPLGNFIKTKMGKIAIHMGGATQILFGIIGKRWYDVPKVKSLFNEYWISPAVSERPAGAEKVEGGTYW